MSVLWQQSCNGDDYRVVQAGQSIRLYRNGIFHSQFNARRHHDGSVWDLLWLPSLFRSFDTPRIAVLGVGGGAILRRFLCLYPSADLTGVDLDPVHLHIARKYFSVPRAVELVEADAQKWLQAYRGKAFDLIVDDVFADAEDGIPVRAIPYAAAQCRWLNRLRQHLTPSGVLIANCASVAEAKRLVASALVSPRCISASRRFHYAASFRSEGIDNVVVALSRQPLERAELAQRLRQIPRWRQLIDPVRIQCHRPR